MKTLKQPQQMGDKGFYICTDTDEQREKYLRKDGKIHTVCGNDGWFLTLEEATIARDAYMKGSPESRFQDFLDGKPSVSSSKET